LLHEAAGQWWWHDLKTMICLRGLISGIFWVHFVLYFLFAGFSNVVKMMISVCLYCFLGSKLCVFLLCKLFCQLPSKNSCPDQIKRVFVCLFFVQLKVGGDANIFVLFLSFWLFGSKLIFTWLKTSRLLWQLWKRCPVVKDCSPITNRFFWMNNLMMKLRVFVCLMLTVGVAQPTR